nr:4767_t:CDS:2 [Entrophospora candida]
MKIIGDTKAITEGKLIANHTKCLLVMTSSPSRCNKITPWIIDGIANVIAVEIIRSSSHTVRSSSKIFELLKPNFLPIIIFKPRYAQKSTTATPCIIAPGPASSSNPMIPVIIPSVLRIILKKSDSETLVVKGKSVILLDEGCEKDVKETVEHVGIILAEEENGDGKDLTLEIKNEDNKRIIDVRFAREKRQFLI